MSASSLVAAAGDLRRPLAVIRSQAALALEADDEIVERSALSAIAAATTEFSRRLENILLFARLASGSSVAYPQPLRLDLLAEKVTTEARFGGLARGVEVAARSTGPLVVSADEGLVHHALGELVDNGIRHGGGAVVTASQRHGTWADVIVSDDGRGVPGERSGDVTRALGGATDAPLAGLGLSIAARVARVHGGACDLLARPAGTSGAAFRLRLPAA